MSFILTAVTVGATLDIAAFSITTSMFVMPWCEMRSWTAVGLEGGLDFTVNRGEFDASSRPVREDALEGLRTAAITVAFDRLRRASVRPKPIPWLAHSVNER
ncbi:hypothetical protein BJ742DRAFT_766440 [Cladochytrium replicatum]|nr:hypothetical protein BJ742DRAFT_766440 [Cladochytrium replicatum]